MHGFKADIFLVQRAPHLALPVMGAGKTFFCLFCLGLATLLLLQKRQSEVVSRLGQTHQSLEKMVDNNSEQTLRTMELSLQKRSLNQTIRPGEERRLPGEKSFVQPEFSELAARYKARRDMVATVCQEQSQDLKARFP